MERTRAVVLVLFLVVAVFFLAALVEDETLYLAPELAPQLTP